MLLQLKTGRVAGYTEGQEPLIYLVSNAQTINRNGVRWVFSDGHGIATITSWFDNMAKLEEIDWTTVHAKIWKDTKDDMDRQRRKQAEFLIYEFCPWTLIHEIGVVSREAKTRVEGILHTFDAEIRLPVNIRSDWYY